VKLLLFSDLHHDLPAAKRLAALADSADVLIGAGNFCNAHHHLSACLDVFRAVKKPLILVPGNNESTDELTTACRVWPHAHVLHGTGVTISGIDFFGIGGGIPVTPFGSWSYDFTEEQADDLLAACPAGCVLVSHSPPYGVVDLSSRGQHLGSKAVRRAVERLALRLVVCGHIHGSAGQNAVIATSPVVNAGPDGILWEVTPR
jgi:Icc-related predicted phosphoesterase